MADVSDSMSLGMACRNCLCFAPVAANHLLHHVNGDDVDSHVCEQGRFDGAAMVGQGLGGASSSTRSPCPPSPQRGPR